MGRPSEMGESRDGEGARAGHTLSQGSTDAALLRLRERFLNELRDREFAFLLVDGRGAGANRRMAIGEKSATVDARPDGDVVAADFFCLPDDLVLVPGDQ